jgi:archaellin
MFVGASAGCNTDGESNGNDNTSQNGGTDGDGSNDSSGNEERDYTDESGRVPADVVREFYEATGTGDVDGVSELLHSDIAGDANNENVDESRWEFVSVETTVVDETPDPSEVPITRLSADERTVVVRGQPTVISADGVETTLRAREFIVATESGNWQLWDLVVGFFHEPPQTLEIEGTTGVVGSPGEIHEVRFTVTPGPESGAVNLSALQIAFFGPQKTNLYANSANGERATGDTHPEDVSPGVFDRPDRPDDRYGVAVVEADQPDNITMADPEDKYELVVDTSGGTNEAGADRLSPLVPGDEVGAVVMTQTRQQFETAVEIPALDGAEVGDRVDL